MVIVLGECPLMSSIVCPRRFDSFTSHTPCSPLDRLLPTVLCHSEVIYTQSNFKSGISFQPADATLSPFSSPSHFNLARTLKRSTNTGESHKTWHDTVCLCFSQLSFLTWDTTSGQHKHLSSGHGAQELDVTDIFLILRLLPPPLFSFFFFSFLAQWTEGKWHLITGEQSRSSANYDPGSSVIISN